ncbi:MAG: hypothetical protein P8Y61_14240 [Gammaproteobacteria bacterium]
MIGHRGVAQLLHEFLFERKMLGDVRVDRVEDFDYLVGVVATAYEVHLVSSSSDAEFATPVQHAHG